MPPFIEGRNELAARLGINRKLIQTLVNAGIMPVFSYGKWHGARPVFDLALCEKALTDLCRHPINSSGVAVYKRRFDRMKKVLQLIADMQDGYHSLHDAKTYAQDILNIVNEEETHDSPTFRELVAKFEEEAGGGLNEFPKPTGFPGFRGLRKEPRKGDEAGPAGDGPADDRPTAGSSGTA